MLPTGSEPQVDHKTRSGTEDPDAAQRRILSAASSRPDRRRHGSAWWRGNKDTGSAAKAIAFERFWDEQGLLWSAFAFAAGITVYFGLPSEPSRFVLAVGGVLLAWILLRARNRQVLSWRAVLVLACAAGLLAGAFRGLVVEAPRLAEEMNAELGGWVLTRQAGLKHDRLVLRVETVNRSVVDEHTFPRKVRLRVPKDSPGRVGDQVRLRGRLFPPPGPVHPGGYDFSFRAYFAGIGATGFSFGAAEVTGQGDGGLYLRAAALVAKARQGLADHIRSVLGDRPETALIVALLVGDRSGISEEQEELLRASGLAHILAISGLHMALFAGGTYGSVLLLLALFPALSLRWPTHKWAAVAALVAATLYLLLSGASVATQRSYLMIALVFLGILSGRRGLTLRSVALAALVLLVLAPERLFFPGFQMSFAAVICLVAVYDHWRRRDRQLQTRQHEPGLGRRVLRSLLQWVLGLVVTALVAGLATGIIGAHHFGRVAPYGVVGNLLGMPVFTLLVMPMGVLSLVLMPLGLAVVPLSLMSFGVSVLLKVADFTAGLDAGMGAVGRLEAGAALLLSGALFAGLLLPGRLRLVSVALFAAGAGLALQSRPPDLQIAATGSRIAARDADGMLRYSGRSNAFVTDLWFQVEGISSQAIKSRKMISPQRRCDSLGCMVQTYGRAESEEEIQETMRPFTVAFPRNLEALADDCRYADLIVSDLVVLGGCDAAVVLDKTARRARGAVSIWLSSRAPPEPAILSGTNSNASDAKVPPPIRRWRIERLVHAIPDPPRPWNAPGTVTRKSLRQAADRSP